MVFDNIEVHKKARFSPLFRKHIFGKTTDENVKLTQNESQSFSGFKVKKVKSATLLKRKLQHECFHLICAIFPKL